MTQHQARKRFGQNFLQDSRIIADIVQAVRPQPADIVVEIGPGLGAITEPLAAKLDCLHVCEIDRDIIGYLKTRPYAGKLVIHEGDVLQFDFSSVPGRKKIVGNLPYNLSSPILFHCLAQREHIHDMHYMLQKEVVDRITAAPGSKTYGRLSLMAQLWCETTALFDIPPDAFDPPPKVDSAVVRLVPRAAPAWQIDDLATFEETVRLAFAQRRKMLRKTFAHWMNAAALEALDIDPTARAETLDGAAFARLANAHYQQERQK